MTASPYDEFFDHDHDGITEYDNPLPGWWRFLFWATIFFSVGYVAYYQIGTGPSIYEEYDAAVVTHLEQQLASIGELRFDDESILRLMHEKPEMIAAVSGMFRSNCAQCHRDDAGGNIGPNLTDDDWKNVKKPVDIARVIRDGVKGTAMAPWGHRLREPQILILAAYVASLRGSHPANPKKPEGQTIPPWPAYEPSQAGSGGSTTAAAPPEVPGAVGGEGPA